MRADAALTIRAYGAARRVAALAAELLDIERGATSAACALRTRDGITQGLIAAAGCAAVVFVAVAAATGGAPWNVTDALDTASTASSAVGSAFVVAAAAASGWVMYHGVSGCHALCTAAAALFLVGGGRV